MMGDAFTLPGFERRNNFAGIAFVPRSNVYVREAGDRYLVGTLDYTASYYQSTPDAAAQHARTLAGYPTPVMQVPSVDAVRQVDAVSAVVAAAYASTPAARDAVLADAGITGPAAQRAVESVSKVAATQRTEQRDFTPLLLGAAGAGLLAWWLS